MSRLRGWLPATAHVVVWLVLSLARSRGLLPHQRTHGRPGEPRSAGDRRLQRRRRRSAPDRCCPTYGPSPARRSAWRSSSARPTPARSNQLTARYAAIGSNPDAQIEKVETAVRDMAIDSIARGLALGILPMLVWRLLGERRRREVVEALPTRRGVVGPARRGAGRDRADHALAGPGHRAPERPERWVPLADFLGPQVGLPEELAGRRGARGRDDRRDRSGWSRARSTPTARAGSSTPTRRRRPASSTSASPRRTRPSYSSCPTGTTTSAWTRWRARSPSAARRRRSSTPATTPRRGRSGRRSPSTRWRRRSTTIDRWAVAGNHDHGSFVRSYLTDLGWTYFDDGEVVDGPGGTRILGADDPRSSGLGNWRDETGLTFDEPRTGWRTRRARRRTTATGSTPCSSTTPTSATRHSSAAASTWSSAATPTSSSARSRSSARTARSATATPSVRRAARRTPSRSAPSCVAPPGSR